MSRRKNPSGMSYIYEHIRIDLESGCWLWLRYVNRDGYGWAWINSEVGTQKVHRVVWSLVFGEIPEGKNVLHICDNRRCCNPDHLFLGTHRQNVDDKVRKSRQARGSRVPTAKLTEELALWVRKVYKSYHPKYGRVKLAKRLGVSIDCIRNIIAGTTWKEL